MNIGSKIKNLFKTNTNTNIINMSDAFVMPKKEDFTSDFITLINKEKEEYLKVIKEKKILLSSELNNKDLREEINLNTSLVLNIFMNETSDKDKMVLIAKLNIYLSVIETLRKEVLSKIIALNEIKKEKIFLNKHKKEVIKLELDNLINTYIMLDAQIKAIIKEKETFFNSYLINFKESSNQELIQRLEYLRGLKSYITKEETKEIPKDKTSIVVEIALIERELEIYAFKNKDKINEYLEILNRYNEDIKIINYKKMIDIENIFNIFYEYGINLVGDSELELLYNVEFRHFTRNIFNMNEKRYASLFSYSSLLFKRNPLRLKYFERIIEAKVNNFIRNNNLNNRKMYEEVLDILKTHHYNEFYNKYSSIISPSDILSSKLCMSLLLSLEKEEQIKYFFNNYKISSSDYQYQNYPYENSYILGKITQNFIKLDKDIPLNTFYKLLYLYRNVNRNMVRLQKDISSLFKLYIEKEKELFKKQENNDIYYIPEGIMSVKYNAFEDNPITSNFIYTFQESSKNKIIICPKSLEEVGIPFLNDLICCKSLVLNDKLKYLQVHNSVMDTLVMPSHIDFNKIRNLTTYKINTIIFKDFKNSKILKDKISLEDLVRHVFPNINEIILEDKDKSYKINVKDPHKYTYDVEKGHRYYEENLKQFLNDVKIYACYNLIDDRELTLRLQKYWWI